MIAFWGNRWEIRKALKSLGKSEDQVAKSLKDYGITGSRCQPYHCPIAQYLNKSFSLGDTAWASNRRAGFLGVHANMPRPVHDFVTAFDNGEYPEMEDA